VTRCRPAVALMIAILMVASTMLTVACGGGTTSELSTTTTTLPSLVGSFAGPGVGRPLSTADPLRVTLIGDSVMWDSAAAITSILESTGVVQVQDRSVLGFNFSHGLRDVHGDDIPWRTEIPRYLAETRPDVIVTGFGLVDELGIMRGNQTIEDFREHVTEAMGLLTASGAKALVLGVMPSVDGIEKRDPKPFARDVNEIFRALPLLFPGIVQYLDPDHLIAPDGLPVYVVEGQRVRKKDLTHICPSGAARLTAGIYETLTVSWPVPPPAAGWESGSWTTDPRYDLPPGACIEMWPGQGEAP